MLELLAESALRSIALGAAVGLGLMLLRVRSPQLRMTAWTAVLLGSLALPALMPWLRITLPADHSHDLVEIAWTRLLPGPAPAGPAALLRGTSPDAARQDALHQDTVRQDAVSRARPEAPGADTGSQSGSRFMNWRLAATAAYLAVAAVMLVRLVMGWLVMWRVVRAARPAGNRFAGGADVRVSDVVRVPLTFASTILLPPASTGWSARRLQAVMLHEGAHVAHGDAYVLLLAAVNRAVFWFNPLAWWLARQLADLAEMVSDDTAIAGLGNHRDDYADTLVDMARNTLADGTLAGSARAGAAQPLPAGLDMARPGTVRRRVVRILSMTAAPVRISAQARAAIAIAIVPLAALSAITIARGNAPADQEKHAVAAGGAATTGEPGKTVGTAASARLVEIAVRFRDQLPLPGGQDAVGQFINDLRRGQPAFERMSPQLADRMRLQSPQIRTTLETLGETQSIFFRGVAPSGLDVYGVKFAGGAAEVRIEILAGGIVRNAHFRPEGDGTLGGVAGCAAEAGLRAAEGTAPIRMVIFNRSGGDISLFSLDAGGRRTADAVFANNQKMEVMTAVERPLIVADADGRCREILMPGQFTRAYVVEAERAGALHGPSATRRNTPVPGSDQILKRHLEELRHGAPDYEAMTPETAAALRPRAAQEQEILSKLGEMRAMWFRGVNFAGDDMYGIQFANGTAMWQIGFARDGRIANLWIAP
jgi:hypothetical protein